MHIFGHFPLLFFPPCKECVFNFISFLLFYALFFFPLRTEFGVPEEKRYNFRNVTRSQNPFFSIIVILHQYHTESIFARNISRITINLVLIKSLLNQCINL
jgi:hypothetical protein